MNRTFNQHLELIGALPAALVVVVAAQLSFPIPGTDIPQTGQTLAVLLVGSILGPLGGALAIILYLLLGLAGLPVFSEGGSGWAALSGPSAGYFAGFVVAAALVGQLLHNHTRRRQLFVSSAIMLLGHVVILTLGAAWLALQLGIAEGIRQGMLPFLYGGLVKSILASGLLWLLASLRDRYGSQLAMAWRR